MEKNQTEECVAGRESQLSSQLSRVEGVANELGDIVKRLSDRLKPALRDSDPSPDCEKKPEDHLVPIADRVRGISRTIQRDVGFLQDIYNRVEL